jgi:hypothetical protein
MRFDPQCLEKAVVAALTARRLYGYDVKIKTGRARGAYGFIGPHCQAQVKIMGKWQWTRIFPGKGWTKPFCIFYGDEFKDPHWVEIDEGSITVEEAIERYGRKG